MLNQLLESTPRRERHPRAALLSASVHVIAVALLVQATARGATPKSPPEEDIKPPQFVALERPPEPDRAPPAQPVVAVTPPPRGFATLHAPIDIPTVIPDVNLSLPVTNPADFDYVTGGVPGGRADGVAGGRTATGDGSEAYFIFEVDRPAQPAPGNAPPSYPGILRSSRIEGEVVASFIVDTTGAADMRSLKILESAHPLFSESVRRALASMRFIPAEIGSRKVAMLVQQAFIFEIEKR